MLLFPLVAFSQDSFRKEYTTYFDSIAGIGDQLIFNGLQFEDMYRSDQKNYRYFGSAGFHKGNILYNGQDFYDIDIRYDLIADEIIVRSKGKLNYLSIQLIKEKVDFFQIEDRNFVFYDANEVLEAGFYEEAYKDDKNILLVKYSKSPREVYKKNQVNFTFKESTVYFIKSGETFKEIDSQRDLKRLFKKESAILRSYPSNSVDEKENFRSYLINLLQHIKRNQ